MALFFDFFLKTIFFFLFSVELFPILLKKIAPSNTKFEYKSMSNNTGYCNYWHDSKTNRERARKMFYSNMFSDCEFLFGTGNDKQV